MHKTQKHILYTHTYTYTSILTGCKLFKLMSGDRSFTLHFNTRCMVPVKAV